MSHLKQMLTKKASDQTTSSRISSPPSSLIREGNHFFNSEKKKQPLFAKNTKKNLQKRLQPFGIQESKVEIYVSKEHLFFFQIAAFFQENEKTWIQIHPNVFKSSLIQKKYTLDEIIAHEMVHCFRKDFEDGFFEEWLAYRTSSSWKKWIGPHLFWIFLSSLLLNAAIFLHSLIESPLFYLNLLHPLYVVVSREWTLWKAKKILGAKYLYWFCRSSFSSIRNLVKTKNKKSFFESINLSKM